jgi:Alpha/beta hydrolase domain
MGVLSRDLAMTFDSTGEAMTERRRSRGTWLHAGLAVTLAALASAGCGSSGSASPAAGPADASTEALATVTGPITGGSTGKPFNAAPIDLASLGYVEEEFFIEGDATAYAFQGTAGSDGLWSVAPTKTAHYKTRMLVRHPSDPAKFNGTVLVEWLNVSGGVDADAEFSFGHAELLRSGFAYVGVSAQAQGVVGGGLSLAPTPDAVPLVKWDPARYGSLKHPGDSYSYDIFTQAAEVVRHPGSVKVLGNLTPARLIGDGESQSAFRLVTYVDAIAPLHPVFEGFFIHSRSGGAAELITTAITGNIIGGPSLALIRGDLTVPVFQFETETDVLGIVPGLLTPFASARQPDGARLHTWEVAGTAHADQYLLDYAAQEVPGEEAGAGLGCTNVNSGPQHWVLDTALNEMNAWVTSGTAPATGAPLLLADAGSGLATDAEGNALGGVRTAAVDVPIATYSGQSQPSASILCSLFGSTMPLPATQLLALYPTHDDYVSKVTAATDAAQQAGFILPADAPLVVQEAQAAPVPQ